MRRRAGSWATRRPRRTRQLCWKRIRHRRIGRSRRRTTVRSSSWNSCRSGFRRMRSLWGFWIRLHCRRRMHRRPAKTAPRLSMICAVTALRFQPETEAAERAAVRPPGVMSAAPAMPAAAAETAAAEVMRMPAARDRAAAQGPGRHPIRNRRRSRSLHRVRTLHRIRTRRSPARQKR